MDGSSIAAMAGIIRVSSVRPTVAMRLRMNAVRCTVVPLGKDAVELQTILGPGRLREFGAVPFGGRPTSPCGELANRSAARRPRRAASGWARQPFGAHAAPDRAPAA